MGKATENEGQRWNLGGKKLKDLPPYTVPITAQRETKSIPMSQEKSL